MLPEAPELPVGALIERIEEIAAALDPEWAKRRQKRAEKNARVILSPTRRARPPCRSATRHAVDGLSMRDRVDALAAAVRQLGVLTPIGPLRAAVAARLLDGSTAGWTTATSPSARRRVPRPAAPGPDDGPG